MYNKGLNGWMKHFDFMILDFIIIEISYYMSYFIRHVDEVGWAKVLLYRYAESFFVLGVAYIFAALLLKTHTDILKRGLFAEFVSVVKLSVSLSLCLLVYMFFQKEFDFSRMVILIYGILSAVLMLIFRNTWKIILKKYRLSTDTHLRHVFLVSTAGEAADVIETIKKNSYGEITIVGMALYDVTDDLGLTIEGVPVVCTVDKMIDYIQKQWIDEVMISLPRGYNIPDKLLRQCNLMGITTHVSLGLGKYDFGNRSIGEVAGIPVMTDSIRIVDGYKLVIKRLMDIAGSIVGLAITLILTIVVGPIIYFADPGPIFFSQRRVGKNGRIFNIYKFRSMYRDAEKRKAELMSKNEMQGQIFKIENDPRIIGSGEDGTKHGIGWFIRKTSIDEFPQFLNVLKGEMSLVGTRPPTIDEWEQYELNHRARLAIKPGLTGMWQAYGRSDITDFEEIIALDMKYINTWSITEDIKILLKTVVSVVSGSGAK